MRWGAALLVVATGLCIQLAEAGAQPRQAVRAPGQNLTLSLSAPLGHRWESTVTRHQASGIAVSILQLTAGGKVKARVELFKAPRCPARLATARKSDTGYRIQTSGIRPVQLMACGLFSVGGRPTALVAAAIVDLPQPQASALFAEVLAQYRAAATSGPAQTRAGAPRVDRTRRSASPSEGRVLNDLGGAGRQQRTGRKRVELRDVREARRRSAQLARKQKKEEVSWVGGRDVFFAELGWRVGLGSPPSRVPEPVIGEFDSDDRSPFLRIGQAWEGRAGAIVGGFYGSAGITDYNAGRASPRAYDVRFGLGGSGKFFSKGGPVKVTSYSSRTTDKYGNECEKVSESDFRDGVRGNCDGQKVFLEVEKKDGYINWPSEWVDAWVAGYGGWRYVQDVLGGDEPDDALSPLTSGGGPILGASVVAAGSFWAIEAGQELVYYAHGWDDRGKLGYGGYIGFGAKYLTMDLRWRLDPGVGKAFMVGARARLDLFFD